MNNILARPKMRRGSGMLPLLGLALLGLLAVIFMAGSASSARPPNAVSAPTTNAAAPSASSGIQEVYLKALNSGLYDQQTLTVKANSPVRLHFSAEDYAGCGKVLIMRDFGVTLVSRNGEDQTAEFTPAPGSYEYACSMRMFRGTLYAE